MEMSPTRGFGHGDSLLTEHSQRNLNDGTATLLNRATGGLSSPGESLAHPSLADKAEWTVGEELGSDHLHITIELRCQTPVASGPLKRARWNTRDVNWQAFSEAVEESMQDMNLRHRIRRLNRAMMSAAAKHVGKPKPGRKTKPWSTPALRDAIKQRNTLRRTVQSSGVPGGVW